MVTDNTTDNGCMYICKRESTDPNYYIKKYFLNERSIKSERLIQNFIKK